MLNEALAESATMALWFHYKLADLFASAFDARFEEFLTFVKIKRKKDNEWKMVQNGERNIEGWRGRQVGSLHENEISLAWTTIERRA